MIERARLNHYPEDVDALYDNFHDRSNGLIERCIGERQNMATRPHKTHRMNRSDAERAELAEWLANFKPKTKLGLNLVTLSKQGLDNGEELLDAGRHHEGTRTQKI